LLEFGFNALFLGAGRPWMLFAYDEAVDGAGDGRPPDVGKKPPGPGDSILIEYFFFRYSVVEEPSWRVKPK